MLTVLAFFLCASLVLYAVFAGADFGAGIIELAARKRDRERLSRLTTQAIAPVWEANHVWLVLALVILFVAFPPVYAEVSTSLHLPLSLVLVGIVARGCAFTFRHYDAIRDRAEQSYSLLFRWSSVLTPFFLGMCAGAVRWGAIDPSAADFAGRFVAPWLNPFCAAMGLFFTCVCAFLAAAFLYSEMPAEEDRRLLASRVRIFSFALVVSGGLVFAADLVGGGALTTRFFSSPGALLMMTAATASVVLLLLLLPRPSVWAARFLAAATVTFVFFGWFIVDYPVLVAMKTGPLTLAGAAAPSETLRAMVWALVVGSALIFPSLAVLIAVFKRPS